MARRSLRIRARFTVVLIVLVPVLLSVIAAGLDGLRSGKTAADVLYRDHLVTSQAVTDLDIALEDAHQASLELLLATSAADQRRVTTRLLTEISPRLENALSVVFAETTDDPAQLPSTQTIAADWAKFQQLFVAGALTRSDPATRVATTKQVVDTFESATTAAQVIIAIEGRQGGQAHQAALGDYRRSVELMLIAGAIGLLCTVGVVAWLIRSVLPRTLSYSAFAAGVGHGDYSHRLTPKGDDEIAELGHVLNELAQRRESADTYDRNQLELIDSLQLAEGEQEAHDLLKHHLELTVADNEVTVLNRNNSADRLQAVTTIDPKSPLAAGLQSAKPRSCLAVRKAKLHSTVPGQDNLLGCPVCSGCPGLTTCTPLIVGGEVIGSVLANHRNALDDIEQRSIREAVSQSAPVIGNQRNLAIAELRAATDSLTGLPNKRAINDSMRRMVAQAGRGKSPLAAMMCDLDHFKQINDVYGHGCGDDVLAAVGAALSDSIRASDFAGRYGGEEFLILLPDTNTEGAKIIAEKVRRAVAAIRIPSFELTVTASVGIAVLPDDANDAQSLRRAADQALYTAKNAGRDRVETYTHEMTRPAETATATSPSG
jgi:diguanylate cyclase (GGDEF)-like protein